MKSKRWLWLPIGFALLGLAGAFYLDLISPEPVGGDVGSEPMVNDFGEPAREVTWTNRNAETRTQVLRIPPEYEGRSVVPVVDRPGSESFVSDGTTSIWFYVAVASMCVLLAAVIEMSLRGYGYVRGSGDGGDTTDLDVLESHGFYWRT